MNQEFSKNSASVNDLVTQMSRDASILNGWDVVLNIKEDIVNQIFQAKFKQSAQKSWKNISIPYCQLFPNPVGSGKIACYTSVNISLSSPSLKFLGDNQAFSLVSFKASGRTGTASMVVADDFDPKKDCNPDDPGLDWTYKKYSEVDFTGKVPLSSITGSSGTHDEKTEFVLDFPKGSFTSPMFDSVKDTDELQIQLKNYLQTHEIKYVINSIKTDLAQQMPQMAPKSFRIAVLTTNENKNVFQIFIATENPARANITIGVNEPIPDGYDLSVIFNKAIADQLKTSMMVQGWLFLESNLVFPGRTELSLGPQFTPNDALILGTLDVDTSSRILPDKPTKPETERPMLNIQKTKQITPTGQPAFTAYGDDADPNAWYIPPKVIWAKDSDSQLPLFSLIKYNSTGGGTSGYCRFSVQLMIDPVQQEALSKTIPEATTPQFDWIQSGAVFTYTIDGKSESVHAQPCNFGSQMVTFSVPLEDEKAIAAFVNGFSKGSQAGNFSVSYDLAANTRLPAVTVVTKFDSTMAYQYQVKNKYAIQTKYHTDTWGHTTSSQHTVCVGTYVEEMLRQSQAGTVQVTPGKGLTPTLLTQVENWANTQLQRDVEEAVNTALQLIKNPTNDFSMSSVSSFTHTLNSTNVVPWYFEVDGTLPVFDNATWEKLYSEVNQQKLDVIFDIQVGLKELGVDRVNLTFEYGDIPPMTHTFKAGKQNPWHVILDGKFEGSTFTSQYKYKYDVVYTQKTGLPRLSTDWITCDSTSVKFGTVELGLMEVTFEASNIRWAGDGTSGDSPCIKEIAIDWNWIAGEGSPLLSENLVLNKSKTSDTSTLRSTRPASNQQYQYSLTFLMDDETKFHANGLIGTSDRQNIDHPLSDMSVSVFPMFPDDAKLVVLRATFDDELNDIHLNNMWQAQSTSSNPKLSTASFKLWEFKAMVANLNTATFVFSGCWVDGKGSQYDIPKTIVVGNNSMLVVSNTQKKVTAVVDASNVKFIPPKTDGVYRVVAQVSNSLAKDGVNDSNSLVNASTITFERDKPPVNYYTTNSIGIDETPVFHYQYTYTENINNAANTQVTNNWNTPQSTQSTALPVIPGTPQPLSENKMTVKSVSLKDAALDDRTRALFDRHESFCVNSKLDTKLLLK